MVSSSNSIPQIPGERATPPGISSPQEPYIDFSRPRNPAPAAEGTFTGQSSSGTYLSYRPQIAAVGSAPVPAQSSGTRSSSSDTVVSSDADRQAAEKHLDVPRTQTTPRKSVDTEHHEEKYDFFDGNAERPAFAPIETRPQRPGLATKSSSRRQYTEDDLFRVLSTRRSSRQNSQTMSRQVTESVDGHDDDEMEEINKLMSRMFGRTRQQDSEEEKTRHVGLVWKNLKVYGMGLGAALQPTTGDIFLGLPRFVKALFTKGPRVAKSKPPIRTIIDDFSGCIKPGEMCLVLGRPGSGCSTFLKVLGNQRFGYEKIEGDVTYGGTDAKTMAKKYRGEGQFLPDRVAHQQ